MTAESYVIVSGSVTFGVPCAIAVWSVVVLRRNGNGSWRPGPPLPPKNPPPKPLPACLIPKPLPGLPVCRERERELV